MEILFRGARSHLNRQFQLLWVRGELTHLYDTTSGLVTERDGAPRVEALERLLLASQLLVVVPEKRLWVSARVFPQILHSPRENVHSDRYQPQDVGFIWLVSAECTRAESR
jgi:hypothetical protein